MKRVKWLALLGVSGLVLSVGTCASDLGTSLLSTLLNALPDLISSLSSGTTSA
jgi:hypothetical protein